jgi:CheY-like chemotaxis protein
MGDQSANRPVALLVEDTPELLRSRQQLFNVSGFQAICVSNAADALREFIATPAVDIIIADINLDRSNEDDVSGVDVAATIREMRPDLPIVAVSGRIDSLKESQCRPFTDTLVKGRRLSAPDFNARLEKWRDDAIAYRERRSQSSKRAVQELEANDDFQAIDYHVIREFLPGRQPVTEPPEARRAGATPDEVLREAGWWLQLVQAGRSVAANGAGSAHTRVAVLVWVRAEGDEYVAVLHAFSSVSCRAASCDEAVEGLFKIMYAYRSGALRVEHVGEAEGQKLQVHLAGIFG